MPRTRPVLAVAALLLALTGCTVPSPTPTPTATPSPTADAGGPLDCDTIVPADEVAAALTGTDGATPAVVPAVQPSTHLADYLTEPAGGLACSWRAGDPPSGLDAEYGSGDWAYLTVEVLPGAATAWDAWAHDEGEHLPVSTFAGVDAVAGCGDPGCDVDLAVADAWLTVSMRADGWNMGLSRYGTTDPMPLLEPVVRSAMASITAAEDLTWPRVDTTGSRECTGALDPTGIGFAIGVQGLAFEAHPWPLDGDAAGRLGVYDCWGVGASVWVTVGRGLAPVLDDLATTADTADLFEPVELEGAVDGERALATCRTPDGGVCSLLFSIGSTAFQVDADDPVAVAEAMIAQAR